jgi:hypothetical protein
MNLDFPAAHSQDTEWFAVDAAGHVAVFVSGENGAVPEKAYRAEDMLALLRQMGSNLPPDEGSEYPAWEVLIAEAVRLGLFVYDHPGFWFCEAYTCEGKPERSLHVDQLPPALRKQIKKVQFQDAHYDQATPVQPCDSEACESWTPLYLSGDGKTVRPMPGREGDFDWYFADMQRMAPEEVKKYHFERPGAKPKARKRRRKGDAGK